MKVAIASLLVAAATAEITLVTNPIPDLGLETARRVRRTRGSSLSPDYALIVDEKNGVKVVDIADPKAPVTVAEVAPDAGEKAYDVTMSTTAGFLCMGGGIRSLNFGMVRFGSIGVSGLMTPSSLLSTNCKAIDMVALGTFKTYAYVAGTKLRVVEWSDPRQVIGSSNMLGLEDLPAEATDILVISNLAYVSHAQGVTIFDVSDPANLKVKKQLSLVGGATDLASCPSGTVYVVGTDQIVAISADGKDISHTDAPGVQSAEVVLSGQWIKHLVVGTKTGVGAFDLHDLMKPTNYQQLSYAGVRDVGATLRQWGEWPKKGDPGYFVGAGGWFGGVFKLAPPAPATCDYVTVNGKAVSGKAVGGAPTIPFPPLTLVHLPEYVSTGYAHLFPLPLEAGSDLTLKCCGSEACDFFVTLLRCPGCDTAVNDLSMLLLNAGWKVGPCSPKFDYDGSLNRMVAYHRTVAPGEDVTLDKTTLQTNFAFIFRSSGVPQPWCPRYTGPYNSDAVVNGPQCSCPAPLK